LRKQTFTRIRQVTIRRSLHYDLKKWWWPFTKNLQQFSIFYLSNKTRFNLVPQVFHNNTILTSKTSTKNSISNNSSKAHKLMKNNNNPFWFLPKSYPII
jgi:hypothetical protein